MLLINLLPRLLEGRLVSGLVLHQAMRALCVVLLLVIHAMGRIVERRLGIEYRNIWVATS